MPMGMFPSIHRLPVKYNTSIGRVITRFADLEATTRHLICAMLGIDRELGRIAVRDPRMVDQITMIEDIMVVKKFRTGANLKNLKASCKQLEEFRDMISHAAWVRHPKSDTPILQSTRGNYPTNQSDPMSQKARIHPRAIRVTLQDFRSAAREIENARKIMRELAKEFAPQQFAWLKKRLEPDIRAMWPEGLPPTPNLKRRKRPPQSSPA